MSKRDPRFKPLKWVTPHREPNVVYQAVGINRVYYIITIGDAHLVLGCNNPEHDAQYYFLSDAKSICQLDHEARLKEWLA